MKEPYAAENIIMHFKYSHGCNHQGKNWFEKF